MCLLGYPVLSICYPSNENLFSNLDKLSPTLSLHDSRFKGWGKSVPQLESERDLAEACERHANQRRRQQQGRLMLLTLTLIGK